MCFGSSGSSGGGGTTTAAPTYAAQTPTQYTTANATSVELDDADIDGAAGAEKTADTGRSTLRNDLTQSTVGTNSSEFLNILQ